MSDAKFSILFLNPIYAYIITISILIGGKKFFFKFFQLELD